MNIFFGLFIALLPTFSSYKNFAKEYHTTRLFTSRKRPCSWRN